MDIQVNNLTNSLFILEICKEIENKIYKSKYPIYKYNGFEYWLEHERLLSNTFRRTLLYKLYWLKDNDAYSAIKFIKRLSKSKNRTFKSRDIVYEITKEEQQILNLFINKVKNKIKIIDFKKI